MKKREIHERLAAARLEAGYQTASEAARAYGWNENTYRSHENGERGLKHDVIAKYARAFGVSYAYIAIDEKWGMPHEGNALPISGSVHDFGKMVVISKDIKAYQVDYYARTQFLFQGRFMAFEVAADEVFGVVFNGDLLIVNKDEAGVVSGVAQLLVVEQGDKYSLTYARLSFGEGISLDVVARGKPDTRIEFSKFWAVAAILPAGQWARVDRLTHGKSRHGEDADD